VNAESEKEPVVEKNEKKALSSSIILTLLEDTYVTIDQFSIVLSEHDLHVTLSYYISDLPSGGQNIDPVKPESDSYAH
jgi:hypothetical protein